MYFDYRAGSKWPLEAMEKAAGVTMASSLWLVSVPFVEGVNGEVSERVEGRVKQVVHCWERMQKELACRTLSR